MNKVVYNNCYGGFSLSVEAVKWLHENARDEIKTFINKRLKDYADDCGESEIYKICGYDLMSCFKENGLPRHDKDLVRCVETLKDDAGEGYSKLEVWHIQGNQYRIEVYDGIEEVLEPKDCQWITIEE